MHFRMKVTNDGDTVTLIKDKNSTGFVIIPINTYDKALVDVVGCSLILIIKPSCVEIPGDCDRQLFFRREAGEGITISSNPECLFIGGVTTLSREYFIQYLFCGSVPTTLTPFNGIEFMSPGSMVNYRTGQVDFTHPSESSSSILKTIEYALKSKASSKNLSVLEYSGGLESNIILHAMHEVGCSGELRLVHITDFESGEADDLAHVRRMASKFGCSLDVIDQLDYPPFQILSCNATKPNFPHSGLVNTGYTNHLISTFSGCEAVVLNGTGGDSMFCAFPQLWRPIELLRSGKAFNAVKSLLELSQYQRLPIIAAAKKSIREYAHIISKQNNPKQYFAHHGGATEIAVEDVRSSQFYFQPGLLPSDMPLDVRDRYINTLVNRYEMQSAPLSAIPGFYHCPFLTAESINAGLSTPTNYLLRGRVDRYYLRKSAMERYNEPTFLRTRKGGCGGLTQKIIKKNKHMLEEFMVDGFLSDFNVIDPDKLRGTLNRVAAGVSYCPRSIINLFTACLFIHQWRDKLRAY